MRFKEVKETKEANLPYEKPSSNGLVPSKEDKQKLTRSNYTYTYNPNNNHKQEYGEESIKGKLRR